MVYSQDTANISVIAKSKNGMLLLQLKRSLLREENTLEVIGVVCFKSRTNFVVAGPVLKPV
jgi:hypothetical protein